MTVIDFQQRKEQISNRGQQFRSGQISESVFRASLMAMGLRRDDVDVLVSDQSPAAVRDREQERFDASMQWLRDYLDEQKGRRH